MRVAPYRREPVRKRPGRLGEPVSVYDDISTLIDDELTEVHSKLAALGDELDAAIRQAHADYDAKIEPLNVKFADLSALRIQVQSLSSQAATDPQVPSVPATTDDTSSASTPATPEDSSSEESTGTPSTSTDQPSTPTTPAGSPSQPSEPDVQDTPPDAIPLAEVAGAIDAGVPSETPVAVPLSTGQIQVVTVDDVIVAADTTIPTAALTEAQKVVRNSDLP